MKLFKKKQKQEQVAPQGLNIETLIDELSQLPPKSMEKVMSLAKDRREYNQKLASLQNSVDRENEKSEENATDPDIIEKALDAIKESPANSFTSVESYIETESEYEDDTEDKKKGKKSE